MDTFVPDWNAEGSFCRPTHRFLPNTKENLDKTEFSYFCALTPFPKFPNTVPKNNIPLQATVKCRKCKSYVTSYANVDPNGKGFTCSVCNFHDSFDQTRKTQGIRNFQRMHSVYDCQRQKPENFGTPTDRILFENRNYVFFIELSKSMVESGTYDALLDKIIDLFNEKTFGFLTIFLFNSSITMPCVPIESTDTKLYTILDLDDPEFFPPQTFLFNLKHGRDKVIPFINNIRKFKPGKVTITLEKFLQVIQPVTAGSGLDAVVVLSEMQMGDTQGIADLGLHHIQNRCRIDFFCLTPGYKGGPNFIQDFSPIAEYATRTGGNANAYCQEQKAVLCSAAVRAAVKGRLTDVTISVRYPPWVEIEDIYGNGLRSQEKVYHLASVEEGTTIYYKLNVRRCVNFNIQFQVTFHDRPFNTFCRVIEHRQELTPSLDTALNSLSLDVILAAELNAVLEEAKARGCPNLRRPLLSKRASEVLRSSNVRSLLARYGDVQRGWLVNGLKAAPDMIDGVGAIRVSGRTPHSIVSFLAPPCFTLALDGTAEGPFVLAEAPSAPLLVHVGRRRTVLYLPPGEDVMKWYWALAGDNRLTEVVAKVSPGDFLEIVSRTGTPGHPALLLIEKLISLGKL